MRPVREVGVHRCLRANLVLSFSAWTSACWRRKCQLKRRRCQAACRHLVLCFAFLPFFPSLPKKYNHSVRPYSKHSLRQRCRREVNGALLWRRRPSQGCRKAEKGGTEKGWEPCPGTHWQKAAGAGYVSAFGWLWEEQVLGLKCLNRIVPFHFRCGQWVSWGEFPAGRSERGSAGDRNEGEQEILLSPCWGERDPHYQHPSYWGYRIWPAWEYSE